MEADTWADQWQDFLKASAEEITAKLEFDYGNKQKQKSSIIEALAFWKFVRKRLPEFHFGADCRSKWEVRQEILSQFIKKGNPLIILIAMIESLPTSVWRRVLWKANIDFASFESFLRRINDDQIECIRECYEDLYAKGKVPFFFYLNLILNEEEFIPEADFKIF